MASNRLPDLSSLINPRIEPLETLFEYLSKIEALVTLALDENFFEYPKTTKHDYLWALSDVIDQAKAFNEKTLNHFLRRL